MRGKRLSERTMGHAKLDMLIDYYLGDMDRRGCTEDSVSTNRRALGRFARTIDLNAHRVTLQEVTEEVVEQYVTNMQRRNAKFETNGVGKQQARKLSPLTIRRRERLPNWPPTLGLGERCVPCQDRRWVARTRQARSKSEYNSG